MQHLTFGESLWISLIGIAIVFAVLAALSLFLWAISKAVQSAERTAVPKPAALSPAAPEVTGTQAFSGEVKLYDVDEKTAAMLMAIVAEETDIPLNELRVLSIREIKEERPISQDQKG